MYTLGGRNVWTDVNGHLIYVANISILAILLQDRGEFRWDQKKEKKRKINQTITKIADLRGHAC